MIILGCGEQYHVDIYTTYLQYMDDRVGILKEKTMFSRIFKLIFANDDTVSWIAVIIC